MKLGNGSQVNADISPFTELFLMLCCSKAHPWVCSTDSTLLCMTADQALASPQTQSPEHPLDITSKSLSVGLKMLSVTEGRGVVWQKDIWQTYWDFF